MVGKEEERVRVEAGVLESIEVDVEVAIVESDCSWNKIVATSL